MSDRLPEPSSTRLRILFADDCLDNRTLAIAYFRNTPHRIEVSVDGADDVDRATHQTFDLSLMDMQMPGVDGYRATANIRAFEAENQLAPTRIIAVTGHTLPDEVARMRLAGCDLHLRKQVLLEAMDREVELREERFGGAPAAMGGRPERAER